MKTTIFNVLPKAMQKAELALVRHGFARATRGMKITLLGDSITYGLGEAKHITNMGHHGLRTDELSEGMPWLKGFIEQAHVVSLMVGTNDAWQGKLDGITHHLYDIVEAIPQTTPLVWSTIPPAGHHAFDLRRIAKINKTIELIAQDRGNTSVIHTWDLFSTPGGWLDRSCFLSDQVHLSPAGYRRWADALKVQINQHRPSSEGFSFSKT